MPKTYAIALIQGDGIGPEITAATRTVLHAVAQEQGIVFEFIDAPAGAKTYLQSGKALPSDSLSACRDSDAILKAPVGRPDVQPGIVERDVVLGLRQELDLYANVRPVKLFSCLREQSCLRADKLRQGIDWLFVRENSEGLYSRQGNQDEAGATDVSIYTRRGVQRILRYAFEQSRRRKKHVTSVDKANVLHTSRYWRQNAHAMSAEYPDVTLRHEYVDAMSQYLLRTPSAFDVIVTDNLFGDILTDQASEIVGSLGLGPGANLNPEARTGMFEPLHGSAPDIAGRDVANPVGMILSAALMLDVMDEPRAADAIRHAVESVLQAGYRTADIARDGETAIGTQEMGRRIAQAAKQTE